MRREALCSILGEAGLADDAEREAIRVGLDPAGPTLLQLAELLRRDHEEILAALEAAVAPTLAAATLTTLPHTPAALNRIAPHDAWDYLVLPASIDTDGTLLCVVCRDNLALALGFLLDHTGQPFRLQSAEASPLEQYIAERYAYEGVNDAA